jgi:hypothetical protein
VLKRRQERRARRVVHEEFLHWIEGEDTAGPESAYIAIAQDAWDLIAHQAILNRSPASAQALQVAVNAKRYQNCPALLVQSARF